MLNFIDRLVVSGHWAKSAQNRFRGVIFIQRHVAFSSENIFILFAWPAGLCGHCKNEEIIVISVDELLDLWPLLPTNRGPRFNGWKNNSNHIIFQIRISYAGWSIYFPNLKGTVTWEILGWKVLGKEGLMIFKIYSVSSCFFSDLRNQIYFTATILELSWK